MKWSVKFVFILGAIWQCTAISTQAMTCETVDECKDQLEQLQGDLLGLDARETEVENSMVHVLEEITETVDAIDTTETLITELQEDIKELEASIESNVETLMELDAEVDLLTELVGQRMRVAQRMTNNNNVVVEMLTEAESVTDFVRRVRVIHHLSQTDAELMEMLTDLVAQQQDLLVTLQGEQAELNTAREELEDEIARLEAYQEELEEKKELIAQELEELEGERLTTEETLAIVEEQKAVLENVVIHRVNIESGSDYFIIPMVSGVVTCEWMCYTNHTGIDLSHSNRQSPILAAAAGVVVTAGWHDSYGNWVVVTHDINGETYSTVYAHLATTPWVNVGDQVEQGQQLGIMGSTGNSTGPHLHFEIHPGGFRWGGAVNPRYYINFPIQGQWW